MTDRLFGNAKADEPAFGADFKAAMRRLAATVTIISTGTFDSRFGMTATAVTSVSMSPPSLLICVNRDASIHAPLLEIGRFCVNLLGRRHKECCFAFGGEEKGEGRFRLGHWSSHEGIPYLADAQASIFCHVERQLDYGTHTVFIGRVKDCRIVGGAEPLIYVDGQFTFENARLFENMAP